jgi:endo-1,3(4)-beta-glucanase
VFTQDPIHGPGATQSEKPLCPLETPLAPGPTAPFQPASANIFQPIDTASPAQSIPFRGGHYVKKEHIVDGDVPIQTNKFYANFFLGGQGNPVWTHPYHLVWEKGLGETGTYGMAVSHTERSQFAYGPPEDGSNPQYFISPIGIHHMVLSAAELGSDTVLSVEEARAFSVYANLAPSNNSPVIMTLPCVQGMGLITAIYNKAKPMIRSGVFFRSFDYIESVSAGTYKWRVTLNDNSRWLFYVTPLASEGVPPFTLVNSSTIAGPSGFIGMIQVAKNPAGRSGEEAFDEAAGAYATSATITGSVDGSTGSYTLSWGKGGVQSKTLLMYALPHHVESFDQETRAALTGITLVTTTKGYAQAVLADRITMLENDLPTTIRFAPWASNSNGGSGGSENVDLGAGALVLVNNVGHAELSQDFIAQTSLNSMYYSGKGLAKFASICYTMSNIAGNRNLAASGLLKLKDAFNVFVNNTQPEPLVYDTVWKGVVSGATYRPPYDPGLDFGNTLYNDHHFHYGYFLYTAAVIGYLDPDWLDEGSNKDWVNTLARDFANPVTDEYFPFQRSFDWFHGHSWAKGLFESGDGKDQESTSEDTFATYALKMWGRIIRDPNMEARGNLQLAVQARSLRNYFLMTSDNKNQPPSFLHNKVTGILFENKIDHTTYFGSSPEFIEGIHMIPLNPTSAYTRRAEFVREEWDTYFSNGRVDQVQGGWKAILYANYALINPQAAYNFFADPNFDTQLDGGASRTWYLAYTAALLGVQTGNVEGDILANSTTGPEENPTNTPKETPTITPKETPTTAPEETPTTAPEETPTTAPEETPTTAPEETPTTAPEETPTNPPVQSSSENQQSPTETAVVPEQDTKWPHGFKWPQKSSKTATTTTTRPTVQNPTPAPSVFTPKPARPVPASAASAPILTRPTPVPAAPRPTPARPTPVPAQSEEGPPNTVPTTVIVAPSPSPSDQQQDDSFDSPDMSWALQDKDPGSDSEPLDGGEDDLDEDGEDDGTFEDWEDDDNEAWSEWDDGGKKVSAGR